MIKMEIALDKQKLAQQGQSAEEIESLIDSVANRNHLKKEAAGLFVGQGTPQDFAYFGNTILTLKNKRGLLTYVAKWLWYTDDGCHDLAERYRSKA